MPILVAGIGIVFTLVMIWLLLGELRENRRRLAERDHAQDAAARRGGDDGRGRG